MYNINIIQTFQVAIRFSSLKLGDHNLLGS